MLARPLIAVAVRHRLPRWLALALGHARIPLLHLSNGTRHEACHESEEREREVKPRHESEERSSEGEQRSWRRQLEVEVVEKGLARATIVAKAVWILILILIVMVTVMLMLMFAYA